MLATHSNEARIANALERLNCASQNFCRIAGIGLTRFQQGLNGDAGKHFSDAQAARLLEVLSELYELQLSVDEIARCHLPVDFRRVDDVLTALTIRRVAKIASEDNDHTLDERALRATQNLAEHRWQTA